MPPIHPHMTGQAGQEIYRLGELAQKPHNFIEWWLRKRFPKIYAVLVDANPSLFDSEQSLAIGFHVLAGYLDGGKANKAPEAAVEEPNVSMVDMQEHAPERPIAAKRRRRARNRAKSSKADEG